MKESKRERERGREKEDVHPVNLLMRESKITLTIKHFFAVDLDFCFIIYKNVGL